jgi:hypothetical protein
MYDLLDRFIANKAVCFYPIKGLMSDFLQAVNHFILRADSSKKVPDLQKNKKYMDYFLSDDDWELLEVIHEVLQV